MSEPLVSIEVDDVRLLPEKLRLMAAVSTEEVVLEVSSQQARVLANWIDHGLRADARVDRERAEAEAAVVRARQHVAEVELLARLWAAMAVAACAVAAVILLLRG
jgi:hypothetical protein